MKIKIVKGDIAIADVDVIVNPANRRLSPGTGICGDIFEAAGLYRLEDECRHIGGCAPGHCVMTGAYKLRSKYLIHTVGPMYRGLENDRELLESAYKNTLLLSAMYEDIKTIAIPPISVGLYGYPLKEATEIAIKTVLDFVKEHNNFDIIYFYCNNDETYNMYNQIYKSMT